MCGIYQELLVKTMNNEITIILSEEEAKKFVEFQRNYATFMLMLEKGVFTIRNGSAILNFDHLGILQNIQRADMLYSKKHEKSY